MEETNQQILKKECDSHCETCPMQWQMQCSARLSHKNNQKIKELEDKIDSISSSLDSVLVKLKGIFGMEELSSSPIGEDDSKANSEIINPETPAGTSI